MSILNRRSMTARSWVRLLLVSVGVDCILSLFFRMLRLLGPFPIDHTVLRVVIWTSLVTLGALLVAAVGTARAIHSSLPPTVGSDLEAVGGTCHAWLWESDAQLRLTWSNHAVIEILGYEAADVIGRTIPSLLAPDSAEEFAAAATPAALGHAGWHDTRATWRHADGHEVVLEGSAVPIVDAIGDLVGFRGARNTVHDADTLAEQTLSAARHRIRHALADRDFDIALQPIVALSNGRLVGAEALSRFRDGRSPDLWFAEARRTGQSLDLERATLLAALPALDDLPPDAYLSLNASPELLRDAELMKRLRVGDLDVTRLVLEITEHTPVDSYDSIRAALLPLRERGLRLAVDDTGAGYASFRHVLQLRPDLIKVDRSLVAQLPDDPACRSLFTALLLLALDLDATVVAEGVETMTELNLLATLGADNAQGYLYAKPTTDHAAWGTWAGRHWLLPQPRNGLASAADVRAAVKPVAHAS